MPDRFELEGEEIIARDVKPFGNSAHVTIPKRWRGAPVKVVRTGEPEHADADRDRDRDECDETP